MEVREILIANTKTQKRSKITTDATTLGELKVALDNAGVDYSGMTFTEGISKTQLLDDATQLPQNIMFKGQPTNNLVILLTNTKKNIASGACSRAEAYQMVKVHNLQESIKEEFSTNYTHVSTNDLWNFIEEHVTFPSDSVEEPKEDETQEKIKEEEHDGDFESTKEYQEYSLDDLISDMSVDTIEDSLCLHIAVLVNNKVLDVSDLQELKHDLDNIIVLAGRKNNKATVPSEPVSTSDGSISNDDVTDMMNDLNM